jgi:hypothetical protein
MEPGCSEQLVVYKVNCPQEEYESVVRLYVIYMFDSQAVVIATVAVACGSKCYVWEEGNLLLQSNVTFKLIWKTVSCMKSLIKTLYGSEIGNFYQRRGQMLLMNLTH